MEQVSEGVRKEILKPGSGNPPRKGNNITVHCTGYLSGDPPKRFWRYIAVKCSVSVLLLYAEVLLYKQQFKT